MISKTGDLDGFVKATKNLDLRRIIDCAVEEKSEALAVRKSGRYVEILNGLLWLLREGSRPSGVHDWEFAGMRPLIETLVERKQLKPEALSVFD